MSDKVVLFIDYQNVYRSARTVYHQPFTTIQTRSPQAVVGRVVGFLSTSEALGVAAGSIIAGLLVDHVELESILNVQAGIYVTAGVSAFLLLRRFVASEATLR